MSEKPVPRYPIYVISKGRFNACMTANFLLNDDVEFRLVIEPQEQEQYADVYGNERLEILPFSNLGLGSIPARNWVWEHAKQTGADRHWILDDNCRIIYRMWKGERIPCHAGAAIAIVEDFVDRFENIAIAGMNYKMFGHRGIPPFFHNVHVYSNLLIRNNLPQRWRGRYNEDTDLCLQVLAAGHCTILTNAFLIDKITTMTMKGGNTDELYADDGRLRMARSLERQWPHTVTVDRRWGRPQHIVADSWKKFDTPLKLKPGIDLANMPANEYGLTPRETKPVKSAHIKKLIAAHPNST